jgi:hypothetical protein
VHDLDGILRPGKQANKQASKASATHHIQTAEMGRGMYHGTGLLNLWGVSSARAKSMGHTRLGSVAAWVR